MITIALHVVWSSMACFNSIFVVFVDGVEYTRIFLLFGMQVFLTNLLVDTNAARIFYKSSQTCGIKTENDRYFGTERVNQLDLVVRASTMISSWTSP
jgi:hypothetical protein